MYLWLLDDKSFIRSPHKRFYLKQNYPDILSEFDSISFKESLPFFQLFWHFLQEDYELKLGLCPVCGKRCDFLFTKLKGYRKHCSFEFQPNIKLKYVYDNIVHYYQPDFLINNKLYEVKGEQFFDGDKMICPYNRNNYLDGIAEAKHQCMLKNNVIILRKNDIEKIKEML